jgi:hypothetical protein
VRSFPLDLWTGKVRREIEAIRAVSEVIVRKATSGSDLAERERGRQPKDRVVWSGYDRAPLTISERLPIPSSDTGGADLHLVWLMAVVLRVC